MQMSFAPERSWTITLSTSVIVTLCLAMFTTSVACQTSPESNTEKATSQQDDLAQYVVPLRNDLFHPTPNNERSTALLQTYFDSLAQWGHVVRTRIVPAPGHPGQLYIGLKRNVEDDVRPTAYAAMVLGFLAECQPPRPVLDDAEKSEMRQEAIGLLRYLVASHVANGGTCLNGKPWGNQWQSSLWSRAVAMAAWQIWPAMDAELQQSTLRLIEFEADRFIIKAPKSSVRHDTGAEENAWNASMTSLACNMMPSHPRAKQWETAAKKYMYNTFSVKADAADATIGDDGLPISEWVTTVNALDDFVVENHGLVHVGYLKNSAAMLQENAIHWTMTGAQSPLACQHHMPEVFKVLGSCMNWDGAAIYFGGNDWRIYETQCSDLIIYSLLRQLAGDQNAAYLEDAAVKKMRQRQLVEGGYYNSRRDLEYGGMCATRLISCFYAHAATDALVEPVDTATFGKTFNRVTLMKSAKAVIHRTPEKFASFAWAQKRMALAIPSGESSIGWPHFASYLGVINGKDSSIKNAKMKDFDVTTNEEGFRVSGTLVRLKGTIAQDFWYASPAGPYTIYVERLRPKKDFKFKSRESGAVGLEYPTQGNHRKLTGEFGEQIAQGTDSEKTVHLLPGRWLNIDGHIGFVVRRSDDTENVMRFHDKNVVRGRKPHLQEWISLVGESTPISSDQPSWACVVTFLNQSAEATKAANTNVEFEIVGDKATCRVDGVEFQIDFSRLGQLVEDVK